jgi:small-conductance mechanosensitive channel
VEFNLGLTYDTSPDKIRSATRLIEDIFRQTANTRFEYAKFVGFADSSLTVNVVYWVNEPAYSAYNAAHERICLQILENFNKNKIEFAYPTYQLKGVEQMKVELVPLGTVREIQT